MHSSMWPDLHFLQRCWKIKEEERPTGTVEKVEVWLRRFFTIDNALYYFFLRDPLFWKISAYQATKQMLLAQYHLIHLPVLLLVKDISNQLLSCWSDNLPNRADVISDKAKDSPGLGSPLVSLQEHRVSIGLLKHWQHAALPLCDVNGTLGEGDPHPPTKKISDPDHVWNPDLWSINIHQCTSNSQVIEIQPGSSF